MRSLTSGRKHFKPTFKRFLLSPNKIRHTKTPVIRSQMPGVSLLFT